MLIGYRILFPELCTFLCVRFDPEVDYVENDYEREQLEMRIMKSIAGTALSILELPDGTYYIGLHPELCQQLSTSIMPTRTMTDTISELTLKFVREIKKVGVFKLRDYKVVSYPDPLIIQYAV